MEAVVLFDGICNFCSASVNFVIKRDKAGYFKFAALQSEAGRELIGRHGIETGGSESIILIEDGRVYSRSAAVLRIARRLSLPWPIAYALIAVPGPIRDFVYRIIARHRYRLFGKRDECMIPTPEVQARFLA